MRYHLLERRISAFSDPIKLATAVVLEAGSRIEGVGTDSSLHRASVKVGDKGEQETQFLTAADLYVQEAILTHLSKQFPEAYFITEEKAEGYEVSLIQSTNLGLVYHAPLVFCVDPIDGTTQFRHRLHEWSISVGVMMDGEHRGGVIYMPALRGGTVVVGERGQGVVMAEGSDGRVEEVNVSSLTKSESAVYTGIGLSYFSHYNRFVNSLAREILVKSTGSCALGLAMIAAGRVGAMIQPAQRPYDWLGGYPLVEEAGGKFQFYHFQEGVIVPLDGPALISYDPNRLHTAFIAGSPKIVDELFQRLCEQWEVSA